MKVTVLGTGIMGTGVARSLLRGGHEVTVFNRTAEKAEALRGDGAQVAATPRTAVADADVVVATLFDVEAVLQVLDAAGSEAPAEAVWLQASTIGLEGTRRVAEVVKRLGLKMVEAMMLGTKTPAEEGALTLLMSGDTSYADGLKPVLDAISAKVIWVGPDLGQASALKLATNAWIGSITAATAQSVALTRGLGLDPQLFLDAIEGGAVDSRYAHIKGKAMMSADYLPSFALDGVVKDIDLMIAAAGSAGVDDALLSTIRALFDSASKAGHGADDMAAVVTAFEGRHVGA